MIRGVQYQVGMDCERLMDAGLVCIEFPYSRKFLEENRDILELCEKKGLQVGQNQLLQDGIGYILEVASAQAFAYVVLETVGMEDVMALSQMLSLSAEDISRSPVRIFVENGYGKNEKSQIINNSCNNASLLKTLVDQCNAKINGRRIGVCLNIGYGNLVGNNIGGMIEILGNRIELIHISDNDGIRDQGQLPYTFTKGRGQLTTNWYGIIGTLARHQYTGGLIFCLDGLWKTSPPELYPAWYRLIGAMGREWERVLMFEQFLKSKDCRIMFGAGIVFENYMKAWGDSYPPSFVVDNNESLWGKYRCGILVRSPQTIFEYEESRRTVLICTNYCAVEKQLCSMGIAALRYDDKYFYKYLGDEIC